MKIELEVEQVEEKTMYLTQHLGDGSLGETNFDASVTLPTMSLLVTVDGKRYFASSQNLISAIIDAHLANK